MNSTKKKVSPKPANKSGKTLGMNILQIIFWPLARFLSTSGLKMIAREYNDDRVAKGSYRTNLKNHVGELAEILSALAKIFMGTMKDLVDTGELGKLQSVFVQIGHALQQFDKDNPQVRGALATFNFEVDRAGTRYYSLDPFDYKGRKKTAAELEAELAEAKLATRSREYREAFNVAIKNGATYEEALAQLPDAIEYKRGKKEDVESALIISPFDFNGGLRNKEEIVKEIEARKKAKETAELEHKKEEEKRKHIAEFSELIANGSDIEEALEEMKPFAKKARPKKKAAMQRQMVTA